MERKIMKFFLAPFCVLTLFPLAVSAQPQPISLHSEIIKIIDGTSFGVTGYKIKLMLHILLKLDHMINGQADKGVVKGIYLLEGKPYSVKQLVALEAQPETEKNSQRCRALKKLLDEIKQDFDEKVASFMQDAHGAKPQLLLLMKESCERRNRENSFLLTWGKAEEGHEKDALYNDIQTFKAFELFCQDLINFLKDMINSCPKAVAQYKELKATYAALHKAVEHDHQHQE